MKKILLLLLSVHFVTLISLAQNKLFWTSQTNQSFFSSDLSGLGSVKIDSNITLTRRVSVDPINQKVYWVVGGTNSIKRSNLDGTNVQTILTNMNGNAAIKIDGVNGILYYSESGSIKSCDTSGGNIQTVRSGTGSVQGIEIDTKGNSLYWAEFSPGKVSKLNLTTNATTLIHTTVNISIIDIELDTVNWHIYVSNRGNGTIQRMDTLGNSLTTILSSPGNIGAISIDQNSNSLYWVTNNAASRDQINQSSLNGTFITSVIDTTNMTIGGIDTYIQPMVTGLASTTKTNSTEILLFPNPVKDYLTVKGEVALNSIVSVYNTSAELVLEFPSISNKNLDVSRLSKGVYFIRFSDQKGNLLTKKIIKL